MGNGNRAVLELRAACQSFGRGSSEARMKKAPAEETRPGLGFA